VLRSELANDPDVLARFAAEARLVSRLESLHVVRVIEVVRDPPLVVMERIDGRSLGATVEHLGALGPNDVVRLGRELLEALAEAHGIGLLHRDIKPDNVFLCAGGAKLLDFGLAALADRGGLVGTIAFMSPEQARGEPSTAASDIYGIGATLYFAAVGRRPFDAPNEASLLTRVEAGGAEPLPAHVPAPLAALILRAMSRAPEERPSAAAMSQALSSPL
jgi:serine/threonine-protein kinase